MSLHPGRRNPRPGVRPSGQNGGTYQRTTRSQSNGGRSLKDEHLAWYREQLRLEREVKETPGHD